jgi:crotonobetainyl-CoA:carnitine CoA-transferase CaiB-like acyl-CoA transferase
MTGRTLAEHGADVLNVGSPGLIDLHQTLITTGHGKRSTYLRLDVPDEAARLRELVTTCDVFVDGYRSGALSARGWGPEELAALRPGIVHVSVNCYGHGGPWSGRRGWEQLAQMVSGLAIGQGSSERPEIVPPGAPNDFLTGILAAYGVMVALERRSREGGSWRVEASLCQTASWIVRNGTLDPAAATGVGNCPVEETDGPLGRLRHLTPAARMGRTPPRWVLPCPRRGSDEPEWLPAPHSIGS